MSRLVWGRVGSRRYETGVDRGVLYLPDGSGVPWNGITAVDEDKGSVEVATHYFDGIAYINTRHPGDYSATLRCVTFPDEFLQFDGYAEVDNNPMLLDNQPVEETFGLSYRTRVGNDLQGPEFGYKIHLVYNITASPESTSYVTMSNQQTPSDFAWKLTALPEVVPGFRPTAHVILDSTKLDPYLMRELEDILYGRGLVANVVDGGTPAGAGLGELDGGDPGSPGLGVIDGGNANSSNDDEINGGEASMNARLPSLTELTDLVTEWRLYYVSDNGDGTWTATGPDELMSVDGDGLFTIERISGIYVEPDKYQIMTT